MSMGWIDSLEVGDIALVGCGGLMLVYRVRLEVLDLGPYLADCSDLQHEMFAMKMPGPPLDC